MICPSCDTINKDDAHVCTNCGIRLTGRQMRPGAEQTEKKYLIAGAIALAAIVVFAVVMITSLSCICGGCGGQGGKDQVADSVEGDWSAETVSGGDVSSTDGGVTGETLPAGE